MTLSKGLLPLLCGVLVSTGVALSLLSNALKTERDTSAQLRRDLQTQTQALNTAQWLLHSQEQTIQLFRAIRMANMAARRDDEKLRDEAQQQITAILSDEECAKRIVPGAAADWLQRLEDRARSGGGNAPAN
jgi:hypothetical protein